jgi:hypothetical protein
MSVVETLRILAAGERPVAGLLHTVRLEAFGVEAYGEEAVIASFRATTMTLSENAAMIQAPGHIALFDEDSALIGDLYNGNIARIWRLGAGVPMPGEPEVSVAFDPDLAQAQGEVFFAASDHPALATEAADIVMRAGQMVTQGSADSYRTRAFATRAWGDATESVALFAVHRLIGDPVRQSGFAMAAAHWSRGSVRIMRDRAGEAAVATHPWSPRIAD